MMHAPTCRDNGASVSEVTERCRRPGSLIVTLLVALLLAGCGALGDDDEQRDYWSPFHSQSSWVQEDGGMHVELAGFERGHQPGEESEFEFLIENRKESRLDLTVCVKLIDEDEIVQYLDDYQIDIRSDTTIQRSFTTTFDEDIEPQAYGLAVIIEDYGALVHTVRLGIADDEAGPWLDVSELSCD